jgi:hypothetical protein
VAVIADGACYNWEIAALHFPGAVQIVDLYHAREHLHALSALLEPGGGQKLKTRWLKMLDKGNVKKIIIQAQKHLPLSKQRREDAQKQINYFQNNLLRMDYPAFLTSQALRRYKARGLKQYRDTARLSQRSRCQRPAGLYGEQRQEIF